MPLNNMDDGQIIKLCKLVAQQLRLRRKRRRVLMIERRLLIGKRIAQIKKCVVLLNKREAPPKKHNALIKKREAQLKEHGALLEERQILVEAETTELQVVMDVVQFHIRQQRPNLQNVVDALW